VSTAAPLPRRLTALARDVVGSCSGHDLLLYAAGLTSYAVVALVPTLLLSSG
jgi:uncharacterized BrkB/YihY/UPF0761 family membrane protein